MRPGNIYFIIGNGDFGTTLDSSGFPANGNCGNCFVKISSTMPMKLLDYFATSNTVAESNADTDFGSGGPVLLPDVVDSTGKTRHLTVGSGKDTTIFVLDRDNMGKFNASKNNVYQEINSQLAGGVWAKPSYFNGMVYYGAVGDSIKAFPGFQRETRRPLRRRTRAARSVIPARRQAFLRTALRTASCGSWRTAAPGSCMLTMRRILATELTTRIRPPTAAIISAATSTSPRWWPTARSS